ncbi:MAG: DUF5799 family protein [Salinigranum sp.]
MSDWTDSIPGDRLAVDNEFRDRVIDSPFSNQEWGLIMTVTDFEIENPGDPDRARIVSNTDKLPAIMPELEKVRTQTGLQTRSSGVEAPPRGDGPDAGGSGGLGGLVDSIKGSLGLGGGRKDEQRLEEAARLTQAYADELQAHLEKKGTWEQVRIAYQE